MADRDRQVSRSSPASGRSVSRPTARRYGGFFTKAEIRQVVAYAAARGITVVPEIEMPGHARAAIAAYPELSCTGAPLPVPATWGVFSDVLCPTVTTFRFLEGVLTEVLELFPSRYIHIGGDEVPKERWRECTECQAIMRREKLKDEHELQRWFIALIGQLARRAWSLADRVGRDPRRRAARRAPRCRRGRGRRPHHRRAGRRCRRDRLAVGVGLPQSFRQANSRSRACCSSIPRQAAANNDRAGPAARWRGAALDRARDLTRQRRIDVAAPVGRLRRDDVAWPGGSGRLCGALRGRRARPTRPRRLCHRPRRSRPDGGRLPL